jgi:hypothetical protein
MTSNKLWNRMVLTSALAAGLVLVFGELGFCRFL